MKSDVSCASYSDWVVDREELKPVKRRSDCNDPEKRMYSIFKCKYCNIEIEVATDSLGKHKKKVIDYHLSKCKSYMGERPVKRNKADTNFRTMIIPCGNVTTMTAHPVSNTQQPNEIETLKMEIANLRESHKALNENHKVLSESHEALNENHKVLSESHEALTKDQEEMKGIVIQHQIYWGCVATAFGYVPPQDPQFLINKIRELKQQQPILLEYKEICHENKKIIELKNEEIQQKNKELEIERERLKQTELDIAESNKKVDELTQELKKATANTARLKRHYEKSMSEYKKKVEDQEYKRIYGMQAFLRKQALEAQKPGCLYKPS